jgi:hypothetical protein
MNNLNFESVCVCVLCCVLFILERQLIIMMMKKKIKILKRPKFWYLKKNIIGNIYN